MKAYIEIKKFNLQDVVTTSSQTEGCVGDCPENWE